MKVTRTEETITVQGREFTIKRAQWKQLSADLRTIEDRELWSCDFSKFIHLSKATREYLIQDIERQIERQNNPTQVDNGAKEWYGQGRYMGD